MLINLINEFKIRFYTLEQKQKTKYFKVQQQIFVAIILQRYISHSTLGKSKSFSA